MSSLVLRLLAAVAPCVALAVTGVAGARLSVPATLVVVAASLWTARRPDGAAALVATLVVGGLWVVGVPDPLGPLVLVLAALLVVGHAAALLAAHGPSRLMLPRALVRRWAARGLVAWLAAAATWQAAVMVEAGSLPAVAWPLGAVVGLAAMLLAGRWVVQWA